jgi:hypothetical protein
MNKQEGIIGRKMLLQKFTRFPSKEEKSSTNLRVWLAASPPTNGSNIAPTACSNITKHW